MPIFKDKISKKDLKRYEEVARKGNPQRAIDLFIAKYIVSLAEQYQTLMKKALRKGENLLSSKETRALSIRISGASTGVSAAMEKLYRKFMRFVYSEAVFKKLKITNPLAKKTIINNSIQLFKENIEGALSRTNNLILSNIRKYQTKLISESARFDALVKTGEAFQKNKAAFMERVKKDILKANPDFEKMLDKDQFIIYRDGSKHRFDDYSEMATRTTALNVERNGVEMQEIIKQRRVSEYFRRDKTPYKTSIRRQVCAEILSKRFKGKSLIAHDPGAAAIFRILTISEARARGAFGPNCKHSIRPLSKTDYNRIETLLFLAEKEAV